MSRRIQGVLAGVLVAALAAGVWLATRAERPGAEQQPPDPSLHLGTPREASTPRAPSGIETSTFEASPELEVSAPPVSGEDFIVEVVAADTGASVPGALVRLFDLSEMLSADWGRLRSEEFRDGRFLLERGRRYLTGADGRVRAHRFPRRALVEAAKGTLWTRRHLTRDDAIPGPLRLVIDQSEGFGARVVDPEGRPVGGVPVWVHWADGSYNLPEWSGPRRVRTDAADGIARFRFPRGTFRGVRKGTWPMVMLGVPLTPQRRRAAGRSTPQDRIQVWTPSLLRDPAWDSGIDL